MASEWVHTTIGELCDRAGGEITTGPFGSQLHAHEYVPDGDVPVVTTSAVGQRRIDANGVPRISREKADSLSRHYLLPGDIVFARRGAQATGLSALVELKHSGWLGGTGIIRLRVSADVVNPSYLSFVLADRRTYEWIRQHAIGATMPNLNEGVIRRLPVELPPLDEQRRIAGVLGALDDKIELNRKMNRTLEEMAQAIFKSWFIDFDGHDDLVDSELGPVPRGWEVVAVTQLLEFNPRSRLAKGTTAKFVEMKSVPTSGFSISEVGERVVKGGGSKFKQGDTLLARITPCLENGKTALVDFLGPEETAFGSTEFIVMRGSPPVGREWVYCLARSADFRQHAISNMTGSSGRQRVPVDCFDHFCAPNPSADCLLEFEATTSALFDRIKSNTDVSNTLSELRDALLPKLISGEIRVPEAERQAEAAL